MYLSKNCSFLTRNRDPASPARKCSRVVFQNTGRFPLPAQSFTRQSMFFRAICQIFALLAQFSEIDAMLGCRMSDFQSFGF